MRISSPVKSGQSLEYQLFWTNDERLMKCVRRWTGKPASDFINGATEQEIGDVLRELGGVRSWRQVSEWILEHRKLQTIETTKQLSAVTETATPGLLAPLFQALRILVNDEYGALAAGLASAWQLLKPGGRLAVISFHSGEHRIVKQLLRELSGVSSISRIFPSTAEQAANPRSRSATLRYIHKPINSKTKSVAKYKEQ
jgi:16S rRNA (cytosine1402-N4)-methyltransferase